jgi:hypothetical protein
MRNDILVPGMRNRRPDMRVSRSRVRYRLSGPLRAVRLEEHPGSSLRKPTSTLVEIPADVIVEQEGAVAPSGLVNILWGGDAFSVFYEDLQEKSHPVTG